MAKSAVQADPVPIPSEGLPECQDYTQTQEVLADFSKDCTDLLVNVNNPAVTVAQANLNSAINAVCDDRRALNKGESTRAFYYSIDYYVAIGTCKDIQGAQKQADDLNAAVADLNKSLAAAVAKLKEACGKLQNVKKLASDWNTAVNASCNSKSKTDLNRLLSPGTPPNQEPPDKLKERAKYFDDTATAAQDAADQVTETGVKVSGILSFTNLKSVKDCMDRLKLLCDAFRTDVEGNIKTAEDKIKAAQKVLVEDLPKLSEADLAYRKANALKESVNAVITYLNVFPPQPDPSMPLAAICMELTNCATDL